jgi:hypothetical protein
MKQFLFSIFISLLPLFIQQNTPCKTSLDCGASSACCKNSVCVEIAQCNNDTRLYYIIVGSVGAFFMLTTFIYFIYVISESRQKINKIKEIVIKREKEIEEFNKLALGQNAK